MPIQLKPKSPTRTKRQFSQNVSLTEEDYAALLALAAETGRKPHAIAQDALRQAIGTFSPRSVRQSNYSG